MNFDKILQDIEVRQEWMDRYKYYVSKFINEAISKSEWQDGEPEIFVEFFEKSKAQCISSLQQGYYTANEQAKIKENWKELSPMLKLIAENQEKGEKKTL